MPPRNLFPRWKWFWPATPIFPGGYCKNGPRRRAIVSGPRYDTSIVPRVSHMFTTRVLLADDHAVVAEGLESLLKKSFDLVGVVHDGHALVDAAEKLRPDVIVTDISMPGLNG